MLTRSPQRYLMQINAIAFGATIMNACEWVVTRTVFMFTTYIYIVSESSSKFAGSRCAIIEIASERFGFAATRPTTDIS